MISDFAKEKVFWTRKMNVKLVKFMERKPNIWNPKHPKYTSVAVKDRTYAEFAAKYGNEFTGQAVKDRWTNIRSTFSNYLRKIKNSRTKTNGEEYKVNWHLWEPCQFLLRVNRGIKTEYVDTNTYNEESYNDNFSEESNEEQSLEYSNISCIGLAKNLATILKGIESDAFSADNTKYSVIGRTVTRKLNQMSSFKAAQAINEITQVLAVYERDSEINCNTFKSEIM